MNVESLLIQVGFDAARFQEALDKLQNEFDELRRQVEDSSRNMSDNIDDTRESTEQLGDAVEDVTKKAEEMASVFSDAFRNIASSIVGPIAGFFTYKAIVGTFIDDVAKLAEETGIYNKQLEEERKKKELLARVTKEDMELYAKWRYSLSSFQYAVQSVAAAFDRTFSPAVEKAIQWLDKITNWIRANENNLVRFFQVLAAIITVALIPAFLRLAAAIWANPLTWIIALIGILALVIDDLVTYIQGGESELDWFWSKFGTGEEIADKLKKAWEEVVAVWDKVGRHVVIFIGILAGFKIVGTITSLVSKFGGALKSLFSLILRNPIVLLIVAIADLIVYITIGESLLSNFWKEWGTGEQIATDLKGAFQSLMQLGAQCFEVLTNAVNSFFGYFENCIEPFINLIKSVVGLIKAIFSGSKEDIFNAFDNLFSSLFDLIANIFSSIGEFLANALVTLIEDVIPAVIGALVKLISTIAEYLYTRIAKILGPLWDIVANGISGFFQYVRNIIYNALSGIANIISNIFSELIGIISNIGSGIVQAASFIWDSIVSGASNFGSFVSNIFSSIWNSLANIVSSIGSSIAQAASNIWNTIINGITGFKQRIINGVKGVWESVKNFFSSINLFESGKKLLSTFIDGIKAKAQALIDGVKDIFNTVRKYLPFSDAKIGPFSQLTLSGQRFVSTFGQGAKQNEGELLSTVGSILSGVSNTISSWQAPAISLNVSSPDQAKVPETKIEVLEFEKQPKPQILTKETTSIVREGSRATAQNIGPTWREMSKRQEPSGKIAPVQSQDSKLLNGISNEIKAGFEKVKQSKLVEEISNLMGTVGNKLTQVVNPALIPQLPLFPPHVIPSAVEVQAASMPSNTIRNSFQDTKKAQNTTITTRIGEVVINTQATDSQGIANSISKELESRLSHAGTAASISGVRQ